MKVLKVIVDEMPKSCWDCTMTGNGHYYYCLGIHDLIPASGNKPDDCPLEVETDGWIPVSERLPEPLGWVIGMDNRREVYPCVYEDGQWLNDVQDELPTGCKITHWRPLPDAPKEVMG